MALSVVADSNAVKVDYRQTKLDMLITKNTVLAVSFPERQRKILPLVIVTGSSAKNQRKSNNSYQTRSCNGCTFVNELKRGQGPAFQLNKSELRPLRVFFSEHGNERRGQFGLGGPLFLGDFMGLCQKIPC